MAETTTIQVRKDQAERLKKIQRENGNYKTAIDRLLEGHGESDNPINVEELSKAITDHIGAEVGGREVDSSKIAAQVTQQLDHTILADAVAERVVEELEGNDE